MVFEGLFFEDHESIGHQGQVELRCQNLNLRLHRDDLDDEDIHLRRLADDDNDKSLDVGPNGRPLFTSTDSLYQLFRKDTCTYMKFRFECGFARGIAFGDGEGIGRIKANRIARLTEFLGPS